MVLQTTRNPQLSLSPASSKLPQLPFEHLLRCHLEVETDDGTFSVSYKRLTLKNDPKIHKLQKLEVTIMSGYLMFDVALKKSFMPEFQMWDSISVTIH